MTIMERSGAADGGTWQAATGLPGTLQLVGGAPIVPGSRSHALITRGRLPDFFVSENPAYSIAFVLTGQSRYEWRRGRTLKQPWASPGGFSIASGWGQNAFRFETELESLNLAIGDADLRTLLATEFAAEAGDVALIDTERSTTPAILSLARDLAALIRTPRPGSRLYIESLWNQLTLQLLWNCSSLSRRRPRTPERLADPRIQRVIEFIEDGLGEDLSLGVLADVAGLSPNYFLGAFKRTTGRTPHQFLTERRVRRACEHLRNPALSLTQIALRLGYSSQSHFTSVFRRVLGVTPGVFRSQALGRTDPEAP